MTEERLAEIRDKNDLARECVRDPACPVQFVAPLVEYVEELLTEAGRLRAERAAERERCAKVAESLFADPPVPSYPTQFGSLGPATVYADAVRATAGRDIAAAIRRLT